MYINPDELNVKTPDLDQIRRNKTSRTLFIFAWIIEIFAVATGLLISVLVGVSTYRQNELIDESGGVTDFTNVLIAAIPFFMVSIVEFAKIPTAQATYATSNYFWKLIFSLLLVFLAFITFETALNGFERNFTSLNFEVSKLTNDRETLVQQYDYLIEQNERDKSLTRDSVLSENEAQVQTLIVTRDTSLNTLLQQEATIQLAANNVLADAVRQRVSDLQSQRTSAINQRDQEISALQGDTASRREALQNSASDKRADLQRQLNNAEAELRNIRDEYTRRFEDATIFTRGGIRSDYEPRIALQQTRLEEINQQLLEFSVFDEVDSQLGSGSSDSQVIYDRYQDRINSIDERIGVENSELARLAGSTQVDIERQRIQIEAERARIQDQYQNDVEIIRQRRELDLENVVSRENRILDNENQMRVLDTQILEINNLINEKAKDNQIYRLAKMFDDDAQTVADVDIGLVNLVAQIWFGSLAMVIAITGILLALASEVVKDPIHNRKVTAGSYKSNFSSIRSLALAINRRLRSRPKTIIEIKELIREVPVEKIVFRDKIQEVIKKEVIHVPIYTNDPSLLRKQDVPT
jgi:hypothetical protein